MGGNVASEHDACALVAVARKDARPARAVLDLVLHGMASLAHRSGVVDGEGDGAGVLTDIPRELWAHVLEQAGRDETAVQLERFAVGHFFHDDPADVATIVAILAGRGIETLLVRGETTDEAALGPRGRSEAPLFLQLALLAPRGAALGSRALYEAGVDIERMTSATGREPVAPYRRVQAPRRGPSAHVVLRRSGRSALRDVSRVRTQPVCDEHVDELHARPA